MAGYQSWARENKRCFHYCFSLVISSVIGMSRVPVSFLDKIGKIQKEADPFPCRSGRSCLGPLLRQEGSYKDPSWPSRPAMYNQADTDTQAPSIKVLTSRSSEVEMEERDENVEARSILPLEINWTGKLCNVRRVSRCFSACMVQAFSDCKVASFTPELVGLVQEATGKDQVIVTVRSLDIRSKVEE